MGGIIISIVYTEQKLSAIIKPSTEYEILLNADVLCVPRLVNIVLSNKKPNGESPGKAELRLHSLSSRKEVCREGCTAVNKIAEMGTDEQKLQAEAILNACLTAGKDQMAQYIGVQRMKKFNLVDAAGIDRRAFALPGNFRQINPRNI
ncbi:MAG TPA: hypothetical protein PLU53_00290 [Bacteroidia bacterium]|nr:hypothetical protein [Bacteroidia bacterium]